MFIHEIDVGGRFPMPKSAMDIAIEAVAKAEAGHEEVVVARKMIAHYITLRHYADAVANASRHPIIGFFRLRKAYRDYMNAKELKVVVEVKNLADLIGVKP